MARTKNPNTSSREFPLDSQNQTVERVMNLDRGTLTINEEHTPSTDISSSSRTITDAESTDSEEETEAMQPLKMYFQPSNYTTKIKIATRCYITEAVESLEKMNLKANELKWFHNHPQFRHFFHMHRDHNHKVMGMWMLLVRTACTDKKKEVWFIVNGVPIRYGLREHALLSGLSCCNYPLHYEELGNMDFIDKYFGRGNKVTYAMIKKKTLKMKYSKERLKMLVLYFLSSVIIGVTKTGSDAPSVERFFLRAVNDLELCKVFPWGRFSFDHTMRKISHTMDHFRGVVKGTLWTIPIFCTPLELLAFEAIPTLKQKFREDIPGADDSCPRMCKSKFKRSAMKGFTLDEINEELGTTKDIKSILVPSPEEESLMAEIFQVDHVDDVDDVIVRSWTKRLIDEKKNICFKKMYNEDVASREEDETKNAPERVENAPEMVENVTQNGLVELVQIMKTEMEEGFKKVNEIVEMVERLTKRVEPLEAYVKEQLDARRAYEGMDYTVYDSGDVGEKGLTEKDATIEEDDEDEGNRGDKDATNEEADGTEKATEDDGTGENQPIEPVIESNEEAGGMENDKDGNNLGEDDGTGEGQPEPLVYKRKRKESKLYQSPFTRYPKPRTEKDVK